MKHFEFSEGTSNKFWEVVANGKELRIRFGKIGSDGQTKLKQLATPAAATAEMAKLIAEKTKKGYRERTNGKSNGATVAAPAVKASNVDPAALAVKPLRAKMNTAHRIAVEERFAIALGNGCMVSSDGKNFHRRTSPGTTYGLVVRDGIVYACGNSYSISRDQAMTWKTVAVPESGYLLALHCDANGTWWMGAETGVLTSKSPDKGWKKASFKTPGKVLDFVEIDGLMFVMGAGSGTWDGKKYKALKGLKKSNVITRLLELPSGTLIAHGDGGVMFRSTDRGASFQPVKSGAKVDLEDSAIVGGAPFVVGGNGVLLRSTNDGKTWQKVDTDTQNKVWTIASWGDGALLGGDDGIVRVLTAAGDTHWRGASDDFAPPPIAVDPKFQPLAARSVEERDKTYKRLYAEAVEAHEARSTRQRAKYEPDKLAKEIDDGGDDALAVYADHLLDQGDPRGELAQLQLRLAKDPKNKELKKAEKALMKQHAAAFLGKLADVQDLLALEWRAGFISKAKIFNTYDREGMYGDEGETKKPPVKIENLLDWLLDEPSGRFLRELSVGIVEFEDNDYGGIATRLGKRYLPALRSLFLGDFHSEETELNWSSLGSLEPMYAALPHLETLHVRSGSMNLGAIVLPKLESFTVTTGGLKRKDAKAICTAKCPGLRSLTVQVGSDNYDADADIKDLAPILDGATLPRLQHLGLTNNEFTDRLIEPLATSRILPQLTSIDLGLGTMGDDGVAAMVRMARAFEHLDNIDLEENYITKAGAKELAKAKLAANASKQREDDGDPEDRYCAAGE
jgi:predicted DNA-binding WGR domain protein